MLFTLHRIKTNLGYNSFTSNVGIDCMFGYGIFGRIMVCHYGINKSYTCLQQNYGVTVICQICRARHSPSLIYLVHCNMSC